MSCATVCLLLVERGRHAQSGGSRSGMERVADVIAASRRCPRSGSLRRLPAGWRCTVLLGRLAQVDPDDGASDRPQAAAWRRAAAGGGAGQRLPAGLPGLAGGVRGAGSRRTRRCRWCAGCRRGFPSCDIAVVVDPTPHGPNRKVANLINMLPAAKHDVLVIADSDVHVAPDWLRRLAAALEAAGCRAGDDALYRAPSGPLPADPLPREAVGAALGAMQINHYFLPGALLARAMGRQDCLGATMMLRRETLERIGGFAALVDHLADDNVLGRLVQRLGLTVRAGRYRAGDHRAGDHVCAPCGATNCAGRARSGRWCRSSSPPRCCNIRWSGPRWPSLLAGGAPWSLAWFAARLGRPRAGRSRHRPARWPLPIAPRSGFCRCASLCRWP